MGNLPNLCDFMVANLVYYFAKRRDGFGFSVVGSILIAAFFGIINYIMTPTILWSIYPIFAVGWWPLIMYYFGRKKKKINSSIKPN